MSKKTAQQILDGADLSKSTMVRLPEPDTQQQILACLQRIESILKDDEADRLRAKKEMMDYRKTVQSFAAPTVPTKPDDTFLN